MKQLILLLGALSLVTGIKAFAQQAPLSSPDAPTEAADPSNCPTGTCYNAVDRTAVGVLSPIVTKQVIDHIDSGKAPVDISNSETAK